jgi:copper chaperone CopZ
MHTVTFAVEGMVCGHCVAAVRAELGRLPGVTGVVADLAAGTVTITGERPVDPAVARAAVEEAGLRLGDPCAPP